jgi:hypothetical protein
MSLAGRWMSEFVLALVPIAVLRLDAHQIVPPHSTDPILGELKG